MPYFPAPHRACPANGGATREPRQVPIRLTTTLRKPAARLRYIHVAAAMGPPCGSQVGPICCLKCKQSVCQRAGITWRAFEGSKQLHRFRETGNPFPALAEPRIATSGRRCGTPFEQDDADAYGTPTAGDGFVGFHAGLAIPLRAAECNRNGIDDATERGECPPPQPR